MHQVDAMAGLVFSGGTSGAGAVSSWEEKDAGGCSHQPEEPIFGYKTLLSSKERATCRHPQHADEVPDEDRMWGHGEINLQTCDNLRARAPEKLAYVVAYDLHERFSKVRIVPRTCRTLSIVLIVDD